MPVGLEHDCAQIGAPLARLEGANAIGSVLKRLADLQLANRISFPPAGLHVQALTHLPLHIDG
jgi:hypothetical protein